MRRFITLLYIIACAITVSAQSWSTKGQEYHYDYGMYPKYEVRAVWLTTIGGIDWPRIKATNATQMERQKKELTDILDKLQRGGINTVLLQARVRGTVIYPSSLEPWDVCLTGKYGQNPGYDPMAFAVEECHKRGMQIHAWVCTIPVGKWNGAGCNNIRKKYSNLLTKVKDDGYLNPTDPRTATVIADVCEEITRKYDIDGIHLDYIRYPEDLKFSYSRSQARDNITRIVKEINTRVKAVKPWVMMSCSPVGKYDDLPRQSARGWNANTRVCQDAQGWLRDGHMDALFPMMYFQGENFYPFARDWKERSYGKIVVPGLGIYFMDPKEKNWKLDTITKEMEACRDWGMGYTYFRSMYFTDNMKGLYDYCTGKFNVYPSLIPAMTWLSDQLPDAPTKVYNDTTNNILSWTGAHDNSRGDYLLYNVYSSKHWPVDVDDVKNLTVSRIRTNRVKVPMDKGRYYAVTAVDRFGNESKPAQNFSATIVTKKMIEVYDTSKLLDCDGETLYVKNPLDMDLGNYAVITSMQGVLLRSMELTKTIDVRNLANGMYQLRTIDKKGVNHRIGFFQIDRRGMK